MSKSIDSAETILITILLLLPLLFIFKKLNITPTINHLLHPLTPTSLATLAQSRGPLMRFNLGTHLLIVASSPAAAADILKTNDRALSARPVPHAVPLSPSEISRLSFWGDPTSNHWRSIRAICRAELFSAAAQEAQARVRDEKAAELVEKLRAVKEGAAIDVGQLVYATVVNVFGNVLFSRDVVADEVECGRVRGLLRGIIGAISVPNLSDLYPFLRALDVQGLRKKHREFSMKVWDLWKPVVEERRERSEFRHADFLDTLISRGFGDDQINHLLEDLFSAGIDTTTSTINRTMIELMATPQSLTKLKHELDAALDHHQHSFTTTSHIENLPYLQACIKETLRLHPPAPLLLSHRAGETCRVMGHTIPKNARVQVNVWAIGRDPTVWEEPLEYRPERFLNSSLDFKGNDFEFLPFGAGRRICPGLPMATKILPLIVASLVYFFDWSPLEGTVDDKFRATSQIRGPLLLIPQPRK